MAANAHQGFPVDIGFNANLDTQENVDEFVQCFCFFFAVALSVWTEDTFSIMKKLAQHNAPTFPGPSSQEVYNRKIYLILKESRFVHHEIHSYTE